MKPYNVGRVGHSGLHIVRNGARVEGTPLWFVQDIEIAKAFARGMNIAFEAGKAET